MMTHETTLKIPGIHCDSCVKTITRTLKALPSVEVTRADAATKLVQVRFDESAANLDKICEALDQVGFSAEEQPSAT